MFKNMSLSGKMGVGFGVLVVISGVLGVLAWQGLSGVATGAALTRSGSQCVDALNACATLRRDFEVRGFKKGEGETKDTAERWYDAFAEMKTRLEALRAAGGLNEKRARLRFTGSGRVWRHAGRGAEEPGRGLRDVGPGGARGDAGPAEDGGYGDCAGAEGGGGIAEGGECGALGGDCGPVERRLHAGISAPARVGRLLSRDKRGCAANGVSATASEDEGGAGEVGPVGQGRGGATVRHRRNQWLPAALRGGR